MGVSIVPKEARGPTLSGLGIVVHYCNDVVMGRGKPESHRRYESGLGNDRLSNGEGNHLRLQRGDGKMRRKVGVAYDRDNFMRRRALRREREDGTPKPFRALIRGYYNA